MSSLNVMYNCFEMFCVKLKNSSEWTMTACLTRCIPLVESDIELVSFDLHFASHENLL